MIPQVGELWINNRRCIAYRIVALPKWSDTPSPVDDSVEALEQWVCVKNTTTGKTFVRSLESFLGTNRDGDPRFTRLDFG